MSARARILLPGESHSWSRQFTVRAVPAMRWTVLDLDAPFGTPPDDDRVAAQLREDLPMLFTAETPADFRWLELASYATDTGSRNRVLVVMPEPIQVPAAREKAHQVLPSLLATLAPCQQQASREDHFLAAFAFEKHLVVWAYWHGVPAHLWCEPIPSSSTALTARLQEIQAFCAQDPCLSPAAPYPMYWGHLSDIPAVQPTASPALDNTSPAPPADLAEIPAQDFRTALGSIAMLPWIGSLDLLPANQQGRYREQTRGLYLLLSAALWLLVLLAPGFWRAVELRKLQQSVAQMHSELSEREAQFKLRDSTESALGALSTRLDTLRPLLGPPTTFPTLLRHIADNLPPGTRIERYHWAVEPPGASLRFEATLSDWEAADTFEKALRATPSIHQLRINTRRQVSAGRVLLQLEVEP